MPKQFDTANAIDSYVFYSNIEAWRKRNSASHKQDYFHRYQDDLSESMQNTHTHTKFVGLCNGGVCSINKPVHIKTDGGECATWPPLCYAVHYGVVDIVKYLISKGVNINCQGWVSKSGVREYFNPLFLACKDKKLDMLKLLVSSGANVNCQIPGNQIEEEEGGSLDYRDVQNTCLHWAVQYGHLEVVQTLLECGADINILNSFMETPLHLACDYYHPLILKNLIFYGAISNNRNHAGLTPLAILMSCEAGNNLLDERKHSIRLLVRAGYNLQTDTCWQHMISCNSAFHDTSDSFPDKPFILTLQNVTCNPNRLLHICRLEIRKLLHYKISAFQFLPISENTKEFLTLPDCCLNLSDVVASTN
ncbi:ankyrin repeat and SOCS box protein 8 isoform X1 [Octopus bimaculoides]|uniref:SOCS box domain-containing protein n=1 Tax=Octopus bimaculoides TaxID=37653 RepID=A0A0L8FGY0_OCTBM|nr:ankyrin repeat and SOCS box protein 8 isoform X1 [Octopus bimaculoides]|eukprot:XP_014789900.1 PREDICTED: ankyrin repeat and SOCS box protein 8-like isoform X1 [Octopus bimaculoides]